MAEESEVKGKPVKSGLVMFLTWTTVVLLTLVVAIGIAFWTQKAAYRAILIDKDIVKAKMVGELEVFPLDEFTIKLADENEPHFIKLNIDLAFGSKERKLSRELEKKRSKIRDIINFTVMEKKSTQLNQIGLKRLKQEILKELNDIVFDGKIREIYFKDVVIQ